MTLWGQSAGAESVDFYNYAYPTDPIVQNLIMDSGNALLPGRSYDSSHSNFTFVASKVGCGGLNAQAELSCMRKVSASKLENFLMQYQDAGTLPAISFVPTPDGKTIFSNYTQRALDGQFADIVREENLTHSSYHSSTILTQSF